MKIILKNSTEIIKQKKKTVSYDVIKKRKTTSNLKSNVLKQFKMNKKMIQTNAEIVNFVNNTSTCSLKSNNNFSKSNIAIKETVTNISSNNKLDMTRENIPKICNSKQKCRNKKICILQNISIPPNSNYTVDLLKKKDVKAHCNVKLGIKQNSLQSDTCIRKPLPSKRKESITNYILQKRLKPRQSSVVLNEGSYILSKIMGKMDKNEPGVFFKPSE